MGSAGQSRFARPHASAHRARGSRRTGAGRTKRLRDAVVEPKWPRSRSASDDSALELRLSSHRLLASTRQSRRAKATRISTTSSQRTRRLADACGPLIVAPRVHAATDPTGRTGRDAAAMTSQANARQRGGRSAEARAQSVLGHQAGDCAASAAGSSGGNSSALAVDRQREEAGVGARRPGLRCSRWQAVEPAAIRLPWRSEAPSR